MENFQEKKGSLRILKSWPVLIFLSILILFFGFGVFQFMNENKETTKNRIIAEEKVKELEDRKDKLLFDIDNLNTDEGKERVFRENFGLAKEGENLIVVLDEKNNTEEVKIVPQKGFLNFLKNWFK
ncbi:MAG: septum formation initiator family protein [Patescibacteria group bacterium]